MIRIFALFIIVFLCFFYGIKLLRNLSGAEAWELTKLMTYSIICSVLSIIVLVAMVLIF